LLELRQELLGCGQGQAEMFDPLRLLREHRDLLDSVVRAVFRVDDELQGEVYGGTPPV
jgi:hypothetical protein